MSKYSYIFGKNYEPAPRSGIFRPSDDAAEVNAKRADVWEQCINKYIRGDYPGDGNTSLREMWSEISRTNGTMFGAFGETI